MSLNSELSLLGKTTMELQQKALVWWWITIREILDAIVISTLRFQRLDTEKTFGKQMSTEGSVAGCHLLYFIFLFASTI